MDEVPRGGKARPGRIITIYAYRERGKGDKSEAPKVAPQVET